MNAFISSTSLDLAEYRTAAYEVCNRMQIVPIGMETFGAMGAGATAASRLQLDAAQVYIGIFANRYGHIEAGFDRSVTELEYEHAGTRGIERLCFLSTDAAGLPVSVEHAALLAAFRARVQSTLVRGLFSSPMEFKFLLLHALVKWLFRQRGDVPLLRAVFDPLFTRHARFAGRTAVLQQVDQFIAAPGAACLLITAPAGYGKTALATQIVERHREIAAYHFFTTLYGAAGQSEMLSEQFFVASVTEQMQLGTNTPVADRAAPATMAQRVAAYQQALANAPGEPRLLLLDGLDEVHGWSLLPYLAVPPGGRLKLIATLRDVGQDWAAEYGFTLAHTQHLPLGGLMRDEVAEVLRLAGPVAARFASTGSLLNQVAAVTTPAGGGGSDPLYLACLADDLQDRRIDAVSLSQQPQRLEDYLDGWWQAITEDSADGGASIDLLATLGAALGPVPADDLGEMHASLRRTLAKNPLADAVRRLRRTVAGDARRGYAFAHPRFRDHLRRFPEIAQYGQTLLAHVRAWPQHQGRYALEHLGAHLLQDGDDDALFASVLDPALHAAQRRVLGSARRSLADLALAIERAIDRQRLLDTLRCCATHRRIARSEGLTHRVFAALNARRWAELAPLMQAYALDAKASSTWVLVLRCYLVCAAARADDHDGAAMLVEQFARQFGLASFGATHQAASLCDALIAMAVLADPGLAAAIGVEAGWAPGVAAALVALPPDDPRLPAVLQEVSDRVGALEWTLGEDAVSGVEFIDEERAGEYTTLLRKALIAVAAEPAGQRMVDQAIAALLRNPYPRYRDNGLVALAVAALAGPDWPLAAARIETVLGVAIEREGVTFTCDLASQLVAEADARGLAAPSSAALSAYLARADLAHDRWGTALRCASARAGALAAQGAGAAEVEVQLHLALQRGDGFAGYAVVHLLALAARCTEVGLVGLIASDGLIQRAHQHADRVRDPSFGQDRRQLVKQFASWLAAPAPLGPALMAQLRSMPDADARRSLKDLCSARWLAAGADVGGVAAGAWGTLVVASLADATALDTALGRLFARALRAGTAGVPLLSGAELAEALALCEADIATSRPWELETPPARFA